MDNLKEIVCEEVKKYAGSGRGVNVRLFPLLDDAHQTYAVNAVTHPIRKGIAGVVILARIEGDFVVVEEDRTDKPLLDALLQRGIPRQHIILAYAGEHIPTPEMA